MEKVIFIKYGELSTKKDNINFFLTKLKDNILFALKDMRVNVSYDLGRMFIHTDDDINKVIERVSNVFGIHEINVGYIIDSNDIKDVAPQVLELLKDKEFKTFKVLTKRSDKKIEYTSIELSKMLGAEILKNIPDIKVQVNNPDILINVEYRKDNSLVYFEKIKGLGGYPVGT